MGYLLLKNKMKKLNTNKGLLLFYIMIGVFLIWGQCSCKKKEKQPEPKKVVVVPPQENLYILGGDWKSVGTDTTFTQILHIYYCCDTNNGATAVYVMNYKVWNTGTVLNITPYYWNPDTIQFSNDKPQPYTKTAKFVRV